MFGIAYSSFLDNISILTDEEIAESFVSDV